MSRLSRSVVALCLLAPQFPSATRAQVPIQFEVVSIRPHRFTGDDPSNRRLLPGGRMVVTATNVRTLIRIAFGTDDDRIVGAPGWTGSDAFDIDAITVDHAEVKTPDQLQQLILVLLEERFAFRFHRERKDGQIYWLEAAKAGRLGPALRPADSSSGTNMSTSSDGQKASIKATNMSMTDVAAALGRQAGRSVEDHTGLTGRYSFAIDWSPRDTPDAALPSLFSVLQEQLGLRLKPARGAVETIVVDRIERPSEN